MQNPILITLFDQIKNRNLHETEFHDAVEEIFESLEPLFASEPEWLKNGVIERLVEPER